MIKTVDLTKRFGKQTALNGLNMEVGKGVIYGFVGPNGAGKSTAMLILSTLLSPTSGKAYVCGCDVTEKPEEVRRHIGYMPDFFGVYDNLKVNEYLHFYGATYNIPRHEMERMIPGLLELVNLSDKADAYVDSLSRGMKQRLCLARCLIHDPEVLILDEPASGLDPRARIEMREILKELQAMGKTILISSHILPELAEMADEIGIIEKGRLIAQGKVAEIEARLKVKRVLEVRVLNRLDEAVRFFEDQPLVQAVEADGEAGRLSITYEGGDEEQSGLLRAAVERGLPILSFGEAATDLEEIFMEITKGGDG